MAMNERSTSTETPPYVSFSTFKNTLNNLKELETLPSQLDAVVLKNLSGNARSAVICAFRFFGLLTSDNQPTDKLKFLHRASPEEEKTTLKSLLREYYPDLVDHLPNGTFISLRNAFTFNGTDRMKKECLRFFVAAAKDAGYTISPHILEKAPVRQTVKRRTVGGKRPTRDGEEKMDNSTEKQTQEGFKKIPIPVGLKIWELSLNEDYTDEEVLKFTEIVKLALLKPKAS